MQQRIMHLWWRILTFTSLGIISILLIYLFSSKVPTSSYHTLSGNDMRRLVGGSACKNCRYVGMRIDECGHFFNYDPCDPDACIANYLIDYTCDPGIGTCNAYLDNNQVHAVQYYREDSGCTTNNPTKWTVVFTSYYGSGCTMLPTEARCQKSNGSCNGTLIESTPRSPGILCFQ